MAVTTTIVPSGYRLPTGYPLLVSGEAPLLVDRSLVRLLGDHAAAALVQGIHDRASVGPTFDGHRWAVATSGEWQLDLGITPSPYRRIVNGLRKLGLVVTIQPSLYDRTAWKRIDYARLLVCEAGTPNLLSSVRDVSMSTRDRTAALHALIKRDGLACRYCSSALSVTGDGEKAQIDHVRARARGGTDDLDNLAIVCRRCNSRKGTKLVADFLAAIGNQ